MTEPTPDTLPDWIAVIDEPDQQGFACSGPTGGGCMTRTSTTLVWSPRQTARAHIEGEHPTWVDERGCITATTPATAPHGAPGAPPTPRVNTETPDRRSGAQAGADGLRDRIADAIHSDAQSGHPAGIVNAVLGAVQPEVERADQAEAALDRVRALATILPPDPGGDAETADAHAAGWNDAIDRVTTEIARATPTP